MHGKIKNQLAEFTAIFKANHDPVRAENEKRYLKSPHRFYGLRVPFIARTAKKFARDNPAIAKPELLSLVRALWNSAYHQDKTLAIKILMEYPKILDSDSMPMLERMILQSAGWDHVDGIAIHLAGPILLKYPKSADRLDTWGRSENFWLRRASLIAQILPFRAGVGNKKLFFRLAKKMLPEKEFFIRKGTGWALRELAKTDPESVRAFLLENRPQISGLTMREALKSLPPRSRKMPIEN